MSKTKKTITLRGCKCTRGHGVMAATKNGEDVVLVLPQGLVDILDWHIETQLQAAVAQVIDLAGYRNAHQNADDLLASLPTTGA